MIIAVRFGNLSLEAGEDPQQLRQRAAWELHLNRSAWLGSQQTPTLIREVETESIGGF